MSESIFTTFQIDIREEDYHKLRYLMGRNGLLRNQTYPIIQLLLKTTQKMRGNSLFEINYVTFVTIRQPLDLPLIHNTIKAMHNIFR